MQGLIFDIKEFALHDGKGIRTTVFMKGCPLRCIWCHNPEGLRPEPELLVKSAGCLGCGSCMRPCSHEECKALGRCIHVCPNGLVDVVGKYVDAKALSARIMRLRDVFSSSGGGVTVSGGEPLMQADFVCELAASLDTHRLLESSGFADSETFCRVISHFDEVYLDIKLADRDEHKKYTGVYNDQILENFKLLKKSNIPHTVRVPLIPGITDTKKNLLAISRIVGDTKVELLPYNTLAGAKYASVGMTFTDKINVDLKNEVDVSIFENCVLK